MADDKGDTASSQAPTGPQQSKNTKMALGGQQKRKSNLGVDGNAPHSQMSRQNNNINVGNVKNSMNMGKQSSGQKYGQGQPSGQKNDDADEYAEDEFEDGGAANDHDSEPAKPLADSNTKKRGAPQGVGLGKQTPTAQSRYNQ